MYFSCFYPTDVERHTQQVKNEKKTLKQWVENLMSILFGVNRLGYRLFRKWNGAFVYFQLKIKKILKLLASMLRLDISDLNYAWMPAIQWFY